MRNKVKERVTVLALVASMALTGCNAFGIGEDSSGLDSDETPDGMVTISPENGGELEGTESTSTETDDSGTALERPTHEVDPVVADAEIAKGLSNTEESTLPRIDITMDGDILSRYNYAACTIQVSGTDTYDTEALSGKVRVRGNSTAAETKKPLKIKFDEKVNLLGAGGEKGEKSWVLLANIYDQTGIHNEVSMALYDYVSSDGTFVPMCTPVDVYINGEYQGVYDLCDQVETGDSRVDIDGDVGDSVANTQFLLEQDMRVYWGDGEGEGLSWFWLDDANVAFAVKSPDTEDEAYTEEYTAYVKEYMDLIYETILDGDYSMVEQMIDVDSFINGFLVNDIAKNQDINKSSVYFYTASDGRLTYGPIWDMDLTFGSGEIGKPDSEEEGIHDNLIFEALYSIPEFKAAYISRLKELKDAGLEDVILGLIDSAAENRASLAQDMVNWKAAYTYQNEEMNGLDYDGQIAYMKEWVHTRLEFLYSEYGI